MSFIQNKMSREKVYFFSYDLIFRNYTKGFRRSGNTVCLFFYLNGKMFCYLWYDKGTGFPYLAFVDGGKMTNPNLESGNRKRMKILTINPSEDLPISLLDEFFKEAIAIRA